MLLRRLTFLAAFGAPLAFAPVAGAGTYEVYSCWAGSDTFRNPAANGNGRALEDLRDCVSKIPGVARVWTRDEIYSGAHTGLAPDVWAEAVPGVELSARFGETWERRPPEKGAGWIVNHRQHGIFAFYGRDVDGHTVDAARIYDMCPTILSFFNVPPPPDIDGHVLPVRAERSEPPRQPPRQGGRPR